MKKLYLNCVWLMLAILLPFSASAQGIIITNLQCEAKFNPLGLTEASPRLSWQDVATNATERGQYQTAYQIQVASTPQLLAGNTGDLWDTGEVVTNQMSQIPYAGSPLASDQFYYWHVRAWDKDGQASAWSPSAQWSMGLLLVTNIIPTGVITWTGQGTFINNSILTLAGSASSEVYGVGFGGSGSQTVAGFTFQDYAVSGNMTVADSPSSYGGYLTGGATTGDAGLDSLLAHGVYGGLANAGTLRNLTVGQTYNVLVLLADTRGGAAGGTVFKVNDGLADSPTQAYAFANGSPAIGGYLLGTFTATSTNQILTVENISAAANSQYNLVLVAKSTGTVTPPNTNALVSQWTGQWIGRDDAPSISNTNDGKTYYAATYLRKDFSLSQLPARAVLYVTALGLVEPHLNGARVGSDYFIPGWTDYNKRVYSRAYDVTSDLHLGANTVGAIIGDGWFRGNVSNLGQNYYGTKTRLCAELHLQYAGGTNQVIVSDGSWTAGFGPVQQSDIQSGEQYDARLEISGWDSPGYTNPNWSSATTGAQVAPAIQAAPAEPVQITQTLSPIAVTQPLAGHYVVNFGQNFSGWMSLTLSNQTPGAKIVMQFGEWLNPDGTVYRANLRSAAATDTYICKGGAVETWEPHFTYHGFQYVDIQGLTQAPATTAFTGIVVHSGLTPAGNFECSNYQINKIYTNMLWTMRDNQFDIPTDCDQRDERMGWCDGTEVMGSAMYAAQAESFYGKWYQDDVDGKLDATTFPQMAPTPHKNFGFASGWSDSGVLIPYNVYQTYGDTRLARRFYADMQSHLQHYAATAVNYIGQGGSYGDWLATDGSTPGDLMSTAFYAGCASDMAELAQALGKTNDAVTYRTLFTNIFNAFQSAYVSSDGTVGSGSQSGYVLALHFNLLTPAQRIQAATKFAAAVQAQSGHPSTGMVTTHWLLPMLTSIGRSDLAYAMLAKTDYPSWGYWLGLGATTMLEHWDSLNADGTPNASLVGMNSLCHANFGTCAEWFHSGILGINPLQPGYGKILINPQPGGGLAWAHGYYDSIQGRIVSAWTNTLTTFNLSVSIPANATAEIHVPTTNAAAIMESGVPSASSPGVTYAGFSNNAAIYNVGAGSYNFSSPFSVSVVTPPTLIITTTNQTGSGTGTFYPDWTVQTNGSLIAGQSPGTALGDFSLEASGRSVAALTTSNNLGITLITVGNAQSSSTNYVTCGDGSSAGSTLIYALTNNALGYDLTNITVYGGWANNGRDQQAYSVYYSTVPAPSDFNYLGSVSYNPLVGDGIQDATRVTLTSSSGVLATSVAAVKFDFTSPASENGYCGYAAITVFGTASLPPAIPATSHMVMLSPSAFALNLGNLVPGRNYDVQSTTNLALDDWITETNVVPMQSEFVWSNIANATVQKFYRVVGH